MARAKIHTCNYTMIMIDVAYGPVNQSESNGQNEILGQVYKSKTAIDAHRHLSERISPEFSEIQSQLC